MPEPVGKKVFTREEVAQHNHEADCWIILGNNQTGGAKVYNITSYLDDHPGGAEILLEFAGKDAHEMFEDIGHSNSARSLLSRYEIGRVST